MNKITRKPTTTSNRSKDCDEREEEYDNPKSRRNKDRTRKTSRRSINDKDPRKSTLSRGLAGSANDPSWYAKDPQLMKDAASLAFSNALGLPLKDLTNGAPYTDADNYPTIPGVCTLDYVTAPGIAKSDGDPINVAASNLYSFVRHANSGHTNYDKEDLMLYILAVDEVYRYWSHLVRIYGIARLYSQQNRYYPKAMLEALGVNAPDIFRNLANLRWYINYLRSRMGAMCIPSVFPFIERHIWLQQRIYRDSPNAKAQSYMFTSTKYRVWIEATGGTPAHLETHQYPNTSMTFTDLVNVAEDMIAPIVGSEDFGIMSGDIMKAFQGNVYYLDEISEDYITESVYDTEVLSQIENCVAFGYPNPLSDLDITQVAGAGLRFNPKFDAMPGSTDNYVLNMHKEDVTPEEVMVATRFMAATDLTLLDTNGKFTFDCCGTEIMLRIHWHAFNDAAGTLTSNWMKSRRHFNPNSPSDHNLFVEYVYFKMTFDWSPTFYAYVNTVTNPSWNDYKLNKVLTDFDNYTIIGEEVLRKLHTTAVLSEFDVPKMGAKQSPTS